MNCHDFDERLQKQLDARQCAADDPVLVLHTERCEYCRARLAAWQKVATVMSSSGGQQSRLHRSHSRRWPGTPRSHWALAGCATAIVLSVASLLTTRSTSLMETRATDSASPSPVSDDQSDGVALIAPKTESSQWWHEVHGDWIRRTMPTVRSFQEGVAPLGRTLMRAATILTTGAREQTS